jgi:exodeoxyribonuclease-3
MVDKIRIATINVNGLRAATLTGKSAREGFGLLDWMQESQPAVVAIQELKATRDEITEPLKAIFEAVGGEKFQGLDFEEWSQKRFFVQDDKQKKGHAGVGILIINPQIVIDEVRTPFEQDLNAMEILASGRWLEADLRLGKFKFTLVSVYIHHADSPTVKRKALKAELEAGSPKEVLIDRAQSEMTMNNKHHFMAMMSRRIRALTAQGNELLVVGDYNIAHHEIDIKNNEGNKTKAGFLPEERAWLDLWTAAPSENSDTSSFIQQALETYMRNDSIKYSSPGEPVSQFEEGGLGLTDVCRDLWGPEEATYSWWTYMGRAFDNDAGWRIDYQMATPKLTKLALEAHIDKQPGYSQRWSDHAPVVVDYSIA